jgi:predicted  nucleic acid-binding Zn-ribbon protein
MSVPLDGDGFMRRECPSCERQFKWRPSQDEDPVEFVDQYFCPLCGSPAGLDSWWTPEQIRHAESLIVPEAMQMIQEALDDSFRGNKYVKFEATRNVGEVPVAEALHEPDDMVIIESPCHPNEPTKVPDGERGPFHCLVCGDRFAA